MYRYLKKILEVLNPRQRLYFFVINFFLFIASILEMLSIVVVLPVARIITDGKSIFEEYPMLSFLKNYEIINSSEIEKILVIFMFIIGVIFLTKNLILILIYYIKEKYFFNVRSYVMNKAYLKYIYQSYTSRSNRNSSLFINNIINESALLIDMGIKNYVNFFQEMSLIIVITIFLLNLNIYVTLGSILFLLILFVIIYLPVKKIIKKFSILRQENEEKRIKDLNETFENFKYIKILSLEPFFSKVFSTQNIIINKALYIVSFIAMLPIKFFETSLIVGLFLICFFLSNNGYKIGDVTTILLAFSLCGLRILPALNRIFLYLQSIKFSYPAIDKVYSDLISSIEFNSKNFQRLENFEELNIQIKQFNYFEKDTLFENVDILIEKGNKIFLKGPTGSGKSSLINLITGLTVNEKVQIKINKVLIRNYEDKVYQKINFGFVPQEIFLSNISLKENIVLNNEFNRSKFNKIISICELDKLIKNLKNRENEIIDQNSSNISGGQKQRIAIARALMSDCQILILDEATNALDQETEKKIIENIISSYPDLAIIMISHKDNIEKYCDYIYEIKNNQIIQYKK